MVARPALATLLVLPLAALAGCAGTPNTGAEPAPAGAGDAVDGIVGALDANSSVPAPLWQVGQWWEWQAKFGDTLADGTFCSIVVEAGSAPVLATEQDAQAKHEAAFGHPLLGALGSDLSMSGFGGEWDLLDFPLADGKTWTGTLPNIAWDILPDGPVAVAMAADFDAALQGYRITGHSGEHLLLDGTFLPATGWFGQLNLYDVDPGQEELEVGYTAVNAGLNYTGPYFQHTARLALALQDGNGFTDFPTEGGQPFVQPQPQGTFTLAEGSLLYGLLSAESVAGGRVITLSDPANAQRQVVSHGDLDGNEETLFLDEPGVAGTWTVATTGAGGYSVAYVELYEITLGAFTM